MAKLDLEWWPICSQVLRSLEPRLSQTFLDGWGVEECGGQKSRRPVLGAPTRLLSEGTVLSESLSHWLYLAPEDLDEIQRCHKMMPTVVFEFQEMRKLCEIGDLKNKQWHPDLLFWIWVS